MFHGRKDRARKIDSPIVSQTDRQTDRQSDRQKNRQTDRQTDRQRVKSASNLEVILGGQWTESMSLTFVGQRSKTF